jgi:hypothetical protein
MQGGEFDMFVRVALGRYGIAVDETDLAVMRVAESLYGRARDALMAADLSDLEPENRLDPSRAPEDEQ